MLTEWQKTQLQIWMRDIDKAGAWGWVVHSLADADARIQELEAQLAVAIHHLQEMCGANHHPIGVVNEDGQLEPCVVAYRAANEFLEAVESNKYSGEPIAQAKALAEVAEAAIAWWENKRPLAWDAEQHAQNPEVNTASDSEKRLANAASKLDAARKGE